MAKRKSLNWSIVAANVREAREQLEQIEQAARRPGTMSEGELLVGLSHAYHHLNFAWHIRREPTSRYRSLTARDFNRWSKVPNDVEVARIEPVVVLAHKLGTRRRGKHDEG
ncbi:MAG TPA: hypothetical protein VGP95_18520 [Gemmatimonadaceae bacterium]|jgi:hypothetical protein|nr:hypothetical protein [Gemmatimonadaceae bacterium]